MNWPWISHEFFWWTDNHCNQFNQSNQDEVDVFFLAEIADIGYAELKGSQKNYFRCFLYFCVTIKRICVHLCHLWFQKNIALACWIPWLIWLFWWTNNRFNQEPSAWHEIICVHQTNWLLGHREIEASTNILLLTQKMFAGVYFPLFIEEAIHIGIEFFTVLSCLRTRPVYGRYRMITDNHFFFMFIHRTFGTQLVLWCRAGVALCATPACGLSSFQDLTCPTF